MAHEATLIPGDGTGPEPIEATRRVLEAGEDVYNPSAVGTSEFADAVIEEMN